MVVPEGIDDATIRRFAQSEFGILINFKMKTLESNQWPELNDNRVSTAAIQASVYTETDTKKLLD
jgi:hypothetical protein